MNQKSFDAYWEQQLVKYPNAKKPVIGMGVTEFVGSDRYPFYISKILTNTQVEIVRMDYTAQKNPNSKDGTWQYGENVQYDYTERDPKDSSATIISFRSRTGGWYRKGSKGRFGGFALGYAQYYYDPHF